MKWARHVARMGDRKAACNFGGRPDRRKHMKGLGMDGSIILK